MARRVLITGGFGFVGTHLVELLLAEADVYIHVVDNLVTSPVDVAAYLRQLPDSNRVTYDLCSVADFFRQSNSDDHFDEIYHLASIVGPVGVLQWAGQIVRNIVDDTYRVIELARRDGAKLCDVSTSEVYGGGRDGYCSERDAKIIPAKNSVRLEYAVAKLACEVAIMNTAATTGLNAVIIRPFNISGPRQSPTGGFVLPRFIEQILRGQDLTVYGDGRMIRAFTHVRDVADGIARATRLGKSGEAYNIGNPANKITILELADRVITLTRSQSRVTYVDPKKLFGDLFEEANDKYPDADRAIQELGWTPRAGVDDIIIETYDYMRAGRRD
jgi:nucleoside-diphosphate-sugar epimerase